MVPFRPATATAGCTCFGSIFEQLKYHAYASSVAYIRSRKEMACCSPLYPRPVRNSFTRLTTLAISPADAAIHTDQVSLPFDLRSYLNHVQIGRHSKDGLGVIQHQD